MNEQEKSNGGLTGKRGQIIDAVDATPFEYAKSICRLELRGHASLEGNIGTS